jgi:nuclease S1
VHQPLHCSYELVNGVNDRGGNLKGVTFQGTALNLHALWDHQIQACDTNDPAATSARLIADLQGKDVSAWLRGDFVANAALESFGLAKGTVYPAYYAQDPKSLGADYQARMTPIVDERLERAGVRLAALIESAVGAPSMTVETVRGRVKRAESAATPP